VPPEAPRYTFATPCQFYHIASGLALDFFKVLTKTESERETTLILAKVKMESIPQVLLVGEDSSSSGLLGASGVGDSWLGASVVGGEAVRGGDNEDPAKEEEDDRDEELSLSLEKDRPLFLSSRISLLLVSMS